MAKQPKPLRALTKAIAARLERMLSEVFTVQQNFGVSRCLVGELANPTTSHNDAKLRMDQQVALKQVSQGEHGGLYVGTCMARLSETVSSIPALVYQYHDLPGPRWQVLYALVERMRTTSTNMYINVAEVGVATGSTAEQLLRHCEDVNYTGVDSYAFEDENTA